MTEQPTHGRKISYDAALELERNDGKSIQRLLQNIAAERYWLVSEDFTDHRQFDPPELQSKKAAVILQELEARIAQIIPETLDGKVEIMLLQDDAETKFREAVARKP